VKKKSWEFVRKQEHKNRTAHARTTVLPPGVKITKRNGASSTGKKRGRRHRRYDVDKGMHADSERVGFPRRVQRKKGLVLGDETLGKNGSFGTMRNGRFRAFERRRKALVLKREGAKGTSKVRKLEHTSR